ncbi:hypothetical protein [Cognatishimia sp. F0-27]|uniref:hypothetical protein n=1 Tax=Cognatishimia sp. F0-27 TaxID=2816855 RepID=UPI001D0CCF52|nr:hypothetical protein [Cognatishimia sp. F0-27]MCC1494266.1 hypothetical protein [Cognatishimia sp. F0-27]
MTEVSFLAPGERPEMDARQIEILCADLGSRAAEDVICRTMEDLGMRLCRIQKHDPRRPSEERHKDLRALAAVAGQIGLTGLACVARDVMNCIEYGDTVAEAATTARLGRVGEQALSTLWDLQDLSV